MADLRLNVDVVRIGQQCEDCGGSVDQLQSCLGGLGVAMTYLEVGDECDDGGAEGQALA